MNNVEQNPNQKQMHLVYDEDHDGVLAAAVCLSMGPTSGFKIKTYPIKDKSVFPFEDIDLGPNDVVIVADLSWKRSVMDVIANKVASLRVFEHHSPAYHELGSTSYLHYNANKCSAMIAYDLHGHEYYGPCKLVDIVNTYDTWNKDNPQFPWETVLAFHLGTMSKLTDLAWWGDQLKKSIHLGGLPSDEINVGMAMLRDLEDQVLNLKLDNRSAEFDFEVNGIKGVGVAMPDELRPRGIVTDLLLHGNQFDISNPSKDPTYNMVLLYQALGDNRFNVRVSTSWKKEQAEKGVKALDVAKAFGAVGSHFHTSSFQVEFEANRFNSPDVLLEMVAEKISATIKICPF